MGALALLLYDPALYGPGAPQVSFGAYETFRSLAIFCAGGLGLCGLMGAFQPPARRTKTADEPRVEADQDDGFTTSHATLDGEPDAFRINASPAASPLW